MTEYLFTGRARVSDVEDMINLMFTKDKVYNANMFREKSIPMLKEKLSYMATCGKYDDDITQGL